MEVDVWKSGNDFFAWIFVVNMRRILVNFCTSELSLRSPLIDRRVESLLLCAVSQRCLYFYSGIFFGIFFSSCRYFRLELSRDGDLWSRGAFLSWSYFLPSWEYVFPVVLISVNTFERRALPAAKMARVECWTIFLFFFRGVAPFSWKSAKPGYIRESEGGCEKSRGKSHRISLIGEICFFFISPVVINGPYFRFCYIVAVGQFSPANSGIRTPGNFLATLIDGFVSSV